MCTVTAELRPFHSDHQKLIQLRAALVDAEIADILEFMTPVTKHSEGFSLPIRATCPYNLRSGGACLDRALDGVFPNHQPNPDCAYRRMRERTSNKNSF